MHMTRRVFVLAAALGLTASRGPARGPAPTPAPAPGGSTSATASSASLEQEVKALHAAMVAAFKRDPASVARYYTDDASIMGGGARSVGREQVDRYWREGPRATDW